MAWHDGIEEAERAQIASRGWDKLDGDAAAKALFTSYRQLEKASGTLRGTPVERLMTLPEGDDEAAWKPVFQKLGVPDAPDKYAKPGGIEIDDANLAFLRQAAHAANVPARSFGKFVSEYATRQAALSAEANTVAEQAKQRAATEAAEKAVQTKQANEAVLKSAWGAAYDATLESAKRMAAQLGYTAEDVEALASSQRGVTAMQQFANMAKAGGELRLVTGSAGTGIGGGARDVAEIEAEKAEIMRANAGKMLRGDEAEKVFKRVAELDRELVAARHARRL